LDRDWADSTYVIVMRKSCAGLFLIESVWGECSASSFLVGIEARLFGDVRRMCFSGFCAGLPAVM